MFAFRQGYLFTVYNKCKIPPLFQRDSFGLGSYCGKHIGENYPLKLGGKRGVKYWVAEKRRVVEITL